MQPANKPPAQKKPAPKKPAAKKPTTGTEETSCEEASRRQDGTVDTFDGGDGEGTVGIGYCAQGGRRKSRR
jgi:hypothetical protein